MLNKYQIGGKHINYILAGSVRGAAEGQTNTSRRTNATVRIQASYNASIPVSQRKM